MRSVRPGTRAVCADPSAAVGGSSTGGYLAQCLGGKVGSTKQGAPVQVRSASTTNGVDLALSSAAAVTGHVASRLPHSSTSVVLYRGDDVVSEIDMNGSGAYQFRALPAATYTVCAGAFTQSSYGGRCYRDAAWDPTTDAEPASDATPIEVAAGAAAPGVDIVVPR